MAHKWGLRVWGPPDGAYTQTNPDTGNSWLEEIGSIEISEGGHGPFSAGSVAAARVDAKTDALAMTSFYADPTQQLVIAFQGPAGTGTPADHAYQLSNDDYERILIVTGQNQDYRAALPSYSGMAQLNLGSVESGYWNKRITNLAASTNTGVSAVIQDIEADTGISVTADYGPLPDGVAGYTLDQPAIDEATVGSTLATLTAPYGMWIRMDYSGTYTGDDLDTWDAWWRPSIFRGAWRNGGADLSRLEQIIIERPWLCGFPDYGRQFGDHVWRVTVNGSGGAVGRYTQAGQWPALQIDQSVSGWIDNNTECALSAEHLVHMSAMPHPRIFKCVISLEMFYKRCVLDGMDPDDAELLCWQIGAVRVGDFITFYTDAEPSGGSGVAPPAGSVTSDELLTEVCVPMVAMDQADSPQRRFNHDVTTVTRRWNQTTGWTIELGLRPALGDW